jgi:hypothetical protein
MTRSRKSGCSNSQARTRLGHAERYLEVAQTVLNDEAGAEATVATGNAVLAGIAAADAICCSTVGKRYRGADHRAAADYLEAVTGHRELGQALRDLADYKDQAHYGLDNVRTIRAKAAIRRAKKLTVAARDRVR